ncbi:MAG TPA: CPBP family glutamic-type intramembrane protease [Polyangiaceae bacterium]|nr:CPBP family glutamic-type intramembrane protease [Polyangiaceae bacterium]
MALAAPLKPLVAIPALVGLAYVLRRFFRPTWDALDLEAREAWARATPGEQQRRAACAFAAAAFGLAFMRFFGRSEDFKEFFGDWAAARPALRYDLFSALYGQAWWAVFRVLGYVAVPALVWKLAFRRERVRDVGGLRLGGGGGLGGHRNGRLYLIALALVLPCVAVASGQRDFADKYPIYKLAGRSWLDLAAWEGMYALQFLALEFFFRGWWVNALRPVIGSAAIFSTMVPYCMIHYSKPYLEAMGAIATTVALGSLAVRSGNVFLGFGVHVTVALAMDFAAILRKGELPQALVPW